MSKQGIALCQMPTAITSSKVTIAKGFHDVKMESEGEELDDGDFCAEDLLPSRMAI